MNKLFLSTSFSGQVDYANGLVKPEFRTSIENILVSLRKVGNFSVFCAIEHEGWIIDDQPPRVGVSRDIAEIDKSDVLLAILHGEPSAGVQWEMGYAFGIGKQVFAGTSEEAEPSYFNQGLAELGHVTDFKFEEPDHLTLQLLENI